MIAKVKDKNKIENTHTKQHNRKTEQTRNTRACDICCFDIPTLNKNYFTFTKKYVFCSFDFMSFRKTHLSIHDNSVHSQHRHQTCQYEYNISNWQKIVSNIYNINKASNAKIGQNINKAVYFFARFFRVNLVVCFDSILLLPKYSSALLFSGINPSSERHGELFVGC